MRCGGLPRRGSSVVPLRQTAPVSRLLKPSTRVYSSPNPTQPESSTIGVLNGMPQNSMLRGEGVCVVMVFCVVCLWRRLRCFM